MHSLVAANAYAFFAAGDAADAIVRRLTSLHDAHGITGSGSRWAVDMALPHLADAVHAGCDLWFTTS